MTKSIVFDLGGTLMEYIGMPDYILKPAIENLTALNAGCDFVYISDFPKNENDVLNIKKEASTPLESQETGVCQTNFPCATPTPVL